MEFLKNITRLFYALLVPLMNQRGEVGDGEGDGDPDKLTNDEQKIINGEAGTDDGIDDDSEDDDGDHDDSGDDDDHDQDPAYWKAEAERLRLENEEIKKTAEKPGKGKGEEASPESKPAKSENLRVEYKDTSNPYHGRTLGQIYDIDPDEAFRLSPYHANKIMLAKERAEEKERQEDERYIQKVREEEKEFSGEFARSEFDKDYDALAPKERAHVDAMLNKVSDWMQKNSKWGVTISEAYYLMDRKNLIDKSASKAARKVVDDATRGEVKTIRTNRDGGAHDAEADMSKWSSARMSDHLDTLNGAAFEKFMKEAPQAVKTKFPMFPWS